MKKVITIFMLALFAFAGQAQKISNDPRGVNRIPKFGKESSDTKSYGDSDAGFWFAADLMGAYSLRLHNPNIGLGEVDVAFGYRFNQYFRLGLGAAVRYYMSTNALRRDEEKWAAPLFVTFRGNFISSTYRSVVPIYGLDFGTSIRDGVMFRPSVGIRIGAPRNAFTASIFYMAQNLKGYDLNEINANVDKSRAVSFAGIKLGYEF